MWLHIDAAYGGGLAVVPECNWVTDGFDLADSIVINPHKMLFVPFDFSVLYVREIERLRRVFTLVPEYLRGDAAGAEINYMDYGIQLGRRFRAIKAWMVWRTFGREGMAARIREHLRLAQLFTTWVKQDGRFELSAPTVMGVVCFRFKAANDALVALKGRFVAVRAEPRVLGERLDRGISLYEEATNGLWSVGARRVRCDQRRRSRLFVRPASLARRRSERVSATR